MYYIITEVKLSVCLTFVKCKRLRKFEIATNMLAWNSTSAMLSKDHRLGVESQLWDKVIHERCACFLGLRSIPKKLSTYKKKIAINPLRHFITPLWVFV